MRKKVQIYTFIGILLVPMEPAWHWNGPFYFWLYRILNPQ